jgi:hypothetical protein
MTGAPHSGQTFRVQREFTTISWAAKIIIPRTGDAVRYLVNEAGIRQLIDIGTGLPTMGNVHEAAMAANPATRVVYVDHDPIVLAHARNSGRESIK